MTRTLLCLALLACAAPSADAGCGKGLLKKLNPFKKKASPSAPAASVTCETTWAAQPVPAVNAAGASIQCQGGQCGKVSVRLKMK